VVFVDNGSEDASRGILEKLDGTLKVVDAPGIHVGGVRNRGRDVVESDILVFLDADCVIEPGYFDAVADTLARTDVHVTGCTVDIPDRPHWIEQVWDDLHTKQNDGWVNYLNSGNFVCRAEVFDEIGGFDEALASGEDAEICQRIRASGYRLFEARALRAVHLGNPKTLRGFFRRQVWHGAGALGTFRGEKLDKPFLMTGAHVLSSVAGVVAGLAAGGLWIVLGPLVGTLVIPLAAVGYRTAAARRIPHLPKSVLLYWLYFTGRAVALPRALGLISG
jgi:glycosyltransferase involved in cell wall biosynthesis